MEVIHSDANSKIRDSLKRWNTVKAQSSPRPVVEYTEELVRMPSSSSEMVQNVGQTVSNVGQTVGANKIINATKSVGQEIKGKFIIVYCNDKTFSLIIYNYSIYVSYYIFTTYFNTIITIITYVLIII